jgi:hypothetical protein
MIAITGALAGIFHVLSGPDHLAAVAPLAAADRERDGWPGWSWGLGHAAGVVTVAVAAILLRDLLPPIELISDVERTARGRGADRGRPVGVATEARRSRPRVTSTGRSHTITCTSSRTDHGCVVSATRMRRSTSACCTAWPAARISSACFLRSPCPRVRRRSPTWRRSVSGRSAR